MVVLQIQQLNGFVNYASRARITRGRGRASTTVCVQTQVAPSRTQVKLSLDFRHFLISRIFFQQSLIFFPVTAPKVAS